METLTCLAVIATFTLTSFGSHTCSLSAATHEVKFLPGSTTLSTTEVKRFADWRIQTRKYFPSGFDAIIIVAWEGYGVTRKMAETRVEHVQRLLKNSGMPDSALAEPPQIRHTDMRGADDQMLHTVEIAVAARCPNYCCPASDHIAR
jgi:hypothetical protein